MTYAKFKNSTYRIIKDHLENAIELSDHMHSTEADLITKLRSIDKNRYYVAGGFKSLKGFCMHSLRFGETQAQRIVTQVRRAEPTPKIQKDARSIQC